MLQEKRNSRKLYKNKYIITLGIGAKGSMPFFFVIDRNAPMCNNVLELAGNPSTAFTETDLSPDPKYNFENSLPEWISIIR